MEVLIDTNIFIHREDDKKVPISLQKLERALNEQGHIKLIHPLSANEIRNDPNKKRRETSTSKLETYRELEYPEYPSPDSEFRETVPADSGNGRVDNMLLYAVYNDDVDFLITEDSGIHTNAATLGVSDRVFSIEEGEDFFKKETQLQIGPKSIEATTLGELDLDDEIFDSLKQEYEGFVDWANEHADRKTWVNWCDDGSLGAILVIKHNETEEIGEYPTIERSKRLKISTMKVGSARQGSKLGELLIYIAVSEAIDHKINEIYLTHYVNEDGQDHLVRLISQYGFNQVSQESDGEAIFLKHLTPTPEADLDPVDLAHEFYPSFYDGQSVSKFLIPIQPRYHQKLFTSYQYRRSIDTVGDDFSSEGNAIKKAYLTHSNTTLVNEGDLLLFYRSHDDKAVTSIGVCEQVHYHLTDAAEIKRVVGKRSVYEDAELEEFAEKPTTVLLFSWHFDLPNPVSYSKLRSDGVLTGPLQTITEISNQDYNMVKQRGEIDGRFARD
ncbi:PIN domain-containing protein [Haloferax sp. Atlit-4N]|uniref:PIN domain-containing protein n=1 Tax=Haloferax sp. Atlit-4N TaxID=2077206 RepID=UPI0011C06B2A|nr:PIN domain-containing protein [Haloferax sp. Atlit-4N]